MSRRLLVALALLLALTGCSGGGAENTSPGAAAAPEPEPLPPAAELLAASTEAMSSVRTVAVALQASPAVRAVPIGAANARLTSAGEAVGTVTLRQGQSNVELQFVVVGDALYLKGATGGWEVLPLEFASSVYDPSAVLDPDRGVAQLLRTATGGVTEAKEDVNGAPAYRVRASFAPQALSAVVPGITGPTSGLLWIDQATSRLVKASVDVPDPNDPEAPPAPVTVTLSEFGAPVTVAPPRVS